MCLFLKVINLFTYDGVCVPKKLPEPEVNADDIRTVTKMLFSETFVNLKVRTWNVIHTECC